MLLLKYCVNIIVYVTYVWIYVDDIFLDNYVLGYSTYVSWTLVYDT